MKSVARFLLAVCAAFTLNLSCSGAVPKEIQGSWIINQDKSLNSMKSSPKWKPEDEKALPMIKSMMDKMCMTLSADKITYSAGRRSESITVEHVSSEKKKHVLKGMKGKREILFTFTFDKDGLLNVHSTKSDDMNYFLWNKGKPAKPGESDAAIIADMTKTAMESGLTKSKVTPRKRRPEPVSTEEYEIKYGRLKIHRLSDKAIKELNAMDPRPGRVEVEKDCTQNDFNRISELPWIEDLTIAYNNKDISSFAPLAKITKLKKFTAKSLDASDKLAIDLTPLADLTTLEELDFYGTRVKNTVALSKMTNLVELSFYMSSVDCLACLKGATKLKKLNLYGYGHTFKNYETLLALKELKVLNIYMNKQAIDEHLLPLEKMTSLEEISMSNSKNVTTLSFLKNCKNIKYVNASWCSKLEDISALADKSELLEVSIDDSAITDFSPLKGKTKLSYLNVSKTAFADLSLIKDSTKSMRKIELYKTKVTDISLLNTFTNLSRVTIPKEIPEEQVQALKAALPKARISQK